MGEMLDFHIGERVDMLATISIAPAPNGLPGGERYEALFPGEVVYVWEPFIDVKAGENVFRVPRRAFHESWRGGKPWEFNVKHAEEFWEAEHYDPEDHIDYDGEGD